MVVRALSGESAHRYRGTGRTDGRRSRDERGSILVLFAIFITLFLVACAVVIDVGYWWANVKKAQVAADSCALAAAQSIPGVDPTSNTITDGDGTVITMGECVIEGGGPDYVLENIPEQEGGTEPLHRGTWVEWPYVDFDGNPPDDSQVEATVKLRVGTFFGRIIGVPYVDITRRAVAEQSSGVNEVAVHAHDTNCVNDALGLFGKNIQIQGIVESNADFEVNGENIDTGPATGVHSGSCEIKVDANKGHSFGGQPKPTHDPAPHPWPIYFSATENPFGWPNSCDHVGQNIEFTQKNEVIPPGVYCASESFLVKNEGISGNITVFAPLIKVEGKNTTFAPSQRALDAGKPLLFMHLPNGTPTAADDGPEPTCATGYRNEMTLNAEGINWTGILFNPCDEIRVNGALNAALEGMIVAQTVRINGENFNLKKISVAGLNKTLALTE